MKPLTATVESALVELLAETDALFTPFRGGFDDQAAGAAIFERRAWYPQRGIRALVGGDDEAARRSGNRAWAGLVSRGLARMVGRGKDRGILLTPVGDDTARDLCMCFSAQATFDLVELIEVVKRIAGCQVDDGHEYVLEVDLLGTDYGSVDRNELSKLQHKALPLLCRGWLLSASDYAHHVGYATTPAGRAATRPDRATPFSADEAAADAYTATYLAALEGRNYWRPTRPGVLWIPLGCGSWGQKPEAVVDA